LAGVIGEMALGSEKWLGCFKLVAAWISVRDHSVSHHDFFYTYMLPQLWCNLNDLKPFDLEKLGFRVNTS